MPYAPTKMEATGIQYKMSPITLLLPPIAPYLIIFL
jgi:hypothetical protein